MIKKKLTNKIYTGNRKHLTPSRVNWNFCSKSNIDLDLDVTYENNSTTNVQINDSNIQSNNNSNVSHSNNKQNYCIRSGRISKRSSYLNYNR